MKAQHDLFVMNYSMFSSAIFILNLQKGALMLLELTNSQLANFDV